MALKDVQEHELTILGLHVRNGMCVWGGGVHIMLDKWWKHEEEENVKDDSRFLN